MDNDTPPAYELTPPPKPMEYAAVDSKALDEVLRLRALMATQPQNMLRLVAEMMLAIDRL